MKLFNLGESNSVLNSFVAEIRDKKIQKDSMRFRTNLRRLGEVFAYEISKTLEYKPKEVQTPLGTATVNLPTKKVVVASILRAGLPMHEGILSFFDAAESSFVAAYRKYDAADKFHVNTEYCTVPDLSGKVLIIVDPMMATGSSILLAYRRLVQDGGKPLCTHIVCPITCNYAVDALKKGLPAGASLWTAAIDEELTGHAFIVPGLGDAGDLAFGEKA